jgi:ubiquinone biosynthesis protein UbiJ
MPSTPVWLAAIESALNRSIGGSQQAQGVARRLDGTSLQVNVEGVARIRAATNAGRLMLTSGGDQGADAVISGSPFALFRLFTEGAARTAGGAAAPRAAARGAAARSAAARVSGDAEIAGRYRELFALAHPDHEEELARLIGDLPARRLSLAAQGTIGWLGKFGRTIRENIAEYLQEESRDLVSRPEVEEFIQGVDRLRETADRVEARLAHLEQRVGPRVGPRPGGAGA